MKNWERKFAIIWRNYKRYCPVTLQILIRERNLGSDLLQEFKLTAISVNFLNPDTDYRLIKNAGGRALHHFLKNNLGLRRERLKSGKVGNYILKEEVKNVKTTI